MEFTSSIVTTIKPTQDKDIPIRWMEQYNDVNISNANSSQNQSFYSIASRNINSRPSNQQNLNPHYTFIQDYTDFNQ